MGSGVMTRGAAWILKHKVDRSYGIGNLERSALLGHLLTLWA